MTQLASGVLIIKVEAPGTCQFCNTKAETRPYGPDGKNICFPCAMKPEYRAIADATFEKILDQSSVILVDLSPANNTTNGN